MIGSAEDGRRRGINQSLDLALRRFHRLEDGQRAEDVDFRAENRIDYRRARAVADYLHGRGLERERLETFALGFAYPAAPNKSPRQRSYVDVVIFEDLVPGEHGFRFFPSFYRHVFDTMYRIPLTQAGEPYGLAPIGPCHIRRIEGGILAHGCDMTIEENPYEVGYAYKWMVELEQDQDFVGREALREVAKRGVTRKLVGVELGGARLGAYSDGSMPDFFPVTKDGAAIGKVTSACFSPRLEKNIGYAMVPVEHSQLGAQLVVERPDENVNAVVADSRSPRCQCAQAMTNWLSTASARSVAARLPASSTRAWSPAAR